VAPVVIKQVLLVLVEVAEVAEAPIQTLLLEVVVALEVLLVVQLLAPLLVRQAVLMVAAVVAALLLDLVQAVLALLVPFALFGAQVVPSHQQIQEMCK
jgi:hypothetical protein